MSNLLVGTMLPCWPIGLYLILFHQDYIVGIPIFIWGNWVFAPQIREFILPIKNKIIKPKLSEDKNDSF